MKNSGFFKLNGYAIGSKTATEIARLAGKFDNFTQTVNDVIAGEYDLDEIMITADLIIEVRNFLNNTTNSPAPGKEKKNDDSK